MATVWQQLGAWVANGGNCGTGHLDKFANAGGKWVALLVYNDDRDAESNRKLLPGLRAQCQARGMSMPGWFNGFGEDPVQQAKEMVGIANNLNMPFMILDLEAAYQYPGGDANKMPILLSEIRKYTKKPIGVSTNGMNSSMIYNGRTLDPPQSFYDMGVRCLPQWYSSYYNKDGDTTPQAQMQWLKENGNKDFNFKDPNAKRTNYRGLPLSYVHGTVEATNLEGSSLAQELQDLQSARAFGLTPGFSYYKLENAPDDDFPLLASQKGKLFLV
jgi:hypothetical protein